MSDNGPQYNSDRFKKFEKDWNFEHVFSSPHYPQSNGKAENAIKTYDKSNRIRKRSLVSTTGVPKHSK